MKLKIYLPLATLAFATAVPAPFSVSVSINEGSLSNSIENAVDACTLICAPRKINCPEGQVRTATGVLFLDTNDLMLILHVFLVCLAARCKF